MSEKEFDVLGKDLPRIDALAKVTGRTVFADDVRVPGALAGKLLRSHLPHARIKSIDCSAALALPGVKAVLTGKDLTVNYGIMPNAEDEHALAQDKVRYVGDPVVGVAAVDEATASAALKLVKVEYEELPAYMTIDEALAGTEKFIHDHTRKGNVHKAVGLEFGDVDGGMAAADYVREDLVFYEGNTHMPMEEHSCTAVPEGTDRLTLYSSAQNPHYVHKALAKVLQLPAGHVRVVAQPVGGGFGGKCDPFPHEIVAGKLALVTGLPVKITLTREEVFYTHRGRHPVLMWVKTGFKKDGTITAQHWKNHLDGGAHASYGLASTYYTGALQTTTYKIPAYRFEGLRMYTNKPPCGPKRGHGTPQPRFALELHLDKAAEELGMSPVDIRLKNLVDPFSMTVNHLRITSCGLKECLEKVVEASGYREKHGKLPHGRGIGLAVSAYMSGAGLPLYWNNMDHSQAVMKADRGGGVTLYIGATEIGQGSHTIHVTLVAETLGLQHNDIILIAADTAVTPVDLGSYSSRVTFMSGNAALRAAKNLRAKIAQAAAPKLDAQPEQLEFRHGRVYVKDNPEKGMTFTEACQWAEATLGTVVATGSYRPPEIAGPFKGSGVGPSPAYSYSACVIETDVDPDTGAVNIDKIWIAHDIGRSINPTLVLGQVEGGVYMGLSEALMEGQVFKGHLHKVPSLLEYKTLTSLDMPAVETILVETIDPEGPHGAKEVGQGPLLPVMPAMANAIYDAVGVRIDELPLSPDKIVKALEDKELGRPGRVGPKKLPQFTFPAPTKVDPPTKMLPVGAGD